MTYISDSIKSEGNLTYTSDSPTPSFITTTLNGTTTLTNLSASNFVISGTATGYSIITPDARTLTEGWKLEFYNKNTSPVIIKNSSGTTLLVAPANSYTGILLEDNSTIAGTWIYFNRVLLTTQDIINYSVSSTSSFTTQSGTDTVITGGFSVTPVAGTYYITYNASTSVNANNTDLYCSIYIGGVLVQDSTRLTRSSVSTFFTVMSTQTIQYCNGTDAVEVFVRRVGSNTLTILQRSLALIRMGA